MRERLSKIQKIIFYSIIFFLPTQLGKHFWPDFAFSGGIRIDYFSPTIYLTDILISLLLIVTIANYLLTKKFSIFNFQFSLRSQCLKILNLKFKIFLFIIILLISSINAKNILVSLYGVLKFLEFLFFGIYVSRFIKSKKELGVITFIFSITVILESILANLQYFNQGSINSFFYWLGERTFNGQTSGVANTSIGGQLILRPYGTFPHPNVLAGFFAFGIILLINYFQFLKIELSKNIKRLLYIFSIVLGTYGLFLTMSRSGIFTWIIIVSIFFALKFKQKEKTILTTAIAGFLGFFLLYTLFISPYSERFRTLNLSDESVSVREELIKESILIIKNNPFFGIGLNNYLNNRLNFNANVVSYAMHLQPVHNIYLLITVQSGLIGLFIFVLFLIKTFQKILNQENDSKIMFLELSFLVLIIGFFDHYFLTIQQGQLLMALVFGLCWSRIK